MSLKVRLWNAKRNRKKVLDSHLKTQLEKRSKYGLFVKHGQEKGSSLLKQYGSTTQVSKSDDPQHTIKYTTDRVRQKRMKLLKWCG